MIISCHEINHAKNNDNNTSQSSVNQLICPKTYFDKVLKSTFYSFFVFNSNVQFCLKNTKRRAEN